MCNKRVAGRIFSVWESEDEVSRDAFQREDGVMPPSALWHLLFTASLGPEHQPCSQPLSHPASAPQEAVSVTPQTPCPEMHSLGMADPRGPFLMNKSAPLGSCVGKAGGLWLKEAGSDLLQLDSMGLFARTQTCAATDNRCSHIIYGAYFAQKHGLLVVETFFAFPETNDTAVYFLLGGCK